MSFRYFPAIAVVLGCLMLAASSVPAADSQPLLRFPDVYGDTVVFVHGEDIWTAPTTGGRATRLMVADAFGFVGVFGFIVRLIQLRLNLFNPFLRFGMVNPHQNIIRLLIQPQLDV